MFTVRFFSTGYERRVAAANVGTVADLENPIWATDVDLRHCAQHLLSGSGLGTGPFLATHSDSGEYGVGRHHDVFSRPNQRLCHAVLLFVMLSLWCEGAFWPAILSSVRKSTSDSNQGKIFGLLEGGRGGIELLRYALTVGLYACGLQLWGWNPFMVNAVIMIVLGIVSWFMLPTETLLKSGNDQKAANREVFAGMSVTLRLPEVWLAGIAGFGVYLAYTSMPFF